MKTLKIALKEGRHFDVDRVDGVVTFNTRPLRGARMMISWAPAGAVSVTMMVSPWGWVVFWVRELLARFRRSP